MSYKFEVTREGKTVFVTEHRSCVPDAQVQKQLKANGYRIKERDDAAQS